MSPKLLTLRGRIDEIDTQLLTLLLARAEVVGEISVEKAALSAPIVDESRERTHLAALLSMADARGATPRVRTLVAAVFAGIFHASRALQER